MEICRLFIPKKEKSFITLSEVVGVYCFLKFLTFSFDRCRLISKLKKFYYVDVGVIDLKRFYLFVRELRKVIFWRYINEFVYLTCAFMEVRIIFDEFCIEGLR